MEPEQRNSVVDRASVVATAVMLAFAFTGTSELLRHQHGFLAAGRGLLLLIIALRMLEGELRYAGRASDVAINSPCLSWLDQEH